MEKLPDVFGYSPWFFLHFSPFFPILPHFAMISLIFCRNFKKFSKFFQKVQKNYFSFFGRISSEMCWNMPKNFFSSICSKLKNFQLSFIFENIEFFTIIFTKLDILPLSFTKTRIRDMTFNCNGWTYKAF